MIEQSGKKPKRGIYLLPNLFTITGLFAGFYSMILSIQGFFDTSAILIFIAMIMDSLDGRVARLTNTESAFGVELDSLSDMVSFGVAPALLVFNWSMINLHQFGWLASFLFTATGALRLARFNTQVAHADKRYFQGLPIPAAAGVLASIVWIGHLYTIPPRPVSILIAIITVLTGLLMVSKMRYNSFKGVDLKGKVSFVAIICVVLLFIAISINPPLVLFAGFTLYALSGPVLTLQQIRQRRKVRKNLLKKNSS